MTSKQPQRPPVVRESTPIPPPPPPKKPVGHYPVRSDLAETGGPTAGDGGPAGRMFDPPLDEGIAAIVETLLAAGVETYESCQGGAGHAFPEPTVRFHGGQGAGWKALSVAQEHGLPVSALRRSWSIIDGVPVGPCWEMTFTSAGGQEQSR